MRRVNRITRVLPGNRPIEARAVFLLLRRHLLNGIVCATTAVVSLVLCVGYAGDKKPGREEGEFRILSAGKEIGSEKYVIISSDDAASSSSVVDFKNPGDSRQRVRLETNAQMNGRFVPKTYQLKSDVDGQKGTINGIFSPQQAMFEYIGGRNPRKGGLLVGDQYTILDTNIFHHFIFLVRLFKFGSREKNQRFEVVVPQEQDNGVLRITELEKENIVVRGKKVEARRLKVDSGSVEIYLWVDGQRIMQKLTVPEKQIEVDRQ